MADRLITSLVFRSPDDQAVPLTTLLGQPLLLVFLRHLA